MLEGKDQINVWIHHWRPNPPINIHLVCWRHFFLNSRSKTKPPESEVKFLCTSCGYFHICRGCLCVSHTSISIRHRTQTSRWWKMEQSLSLTTYRLTTHITLTLWAYDPIYLLQMLTALLTSLLHSPQALISPPFFLLLLLACLLLACLLFLVLYLPWFNKGFPPLPFLQNAPALAALHRHIL